jgi:HD-GYP domain-containing protein (c-di-GMP phosphodiesterase class II)
MLSSSFGTFGWGATAGGLDASAVRLQSHLDRMAEEKDLLGRELLRCHEQLSLVFEIAEHIAGLHDPDLIQATLLRRYGAMLAAGAVFLDRGGCCMRIEQEENDGSTIALGPEQIRGVLAAHVELVRRSRRALVPPLTEPEAGALGNARVLLSTLQRTDAEVGVVVALRAADGPPFDAADVLASESVLTYGAQALSNVLMVRHLQRTALETVCTLVNAIDAKDNYTSDHSERVGGFARLTGEAFGLSKARLQVLEWAGLLHDVGKIGISEQILNKPGALTAAEFEQMKRHASIGYAVLKPVAQFEPVLGAVLYHHERHDGAGYPEGLRGDQIPIEARIIHVVDIFDALTTDRPYRRRYDIDRAVEILEEGAGRATDPQVTRLFLEMLRRYRTAEPDTFRTRFGHLLPADGEPSHVPS